MRKYIGEPSLDGGVYSLEQHSDFIREHLGELEMAFRQIRRIEVEDTTESTSLFDGGTDLSGSEKWLGGVLAPNGKIYGIPRNSTTVLCIDPSNNTTSTFGDLSGTFKWYSGGLAPNGKIYGIPRNSTTVLCIDGIGSMSSAKNVLTHPFFNKL